MGGLDYIAEPLRHMAVPIGELAFDPANARLHDEANISSIKGSLRQFGQRQPLIVQRQGMIVRAGNGRLKAAIELGWTHVAAIVVDESEAQAVAFAITDNRSAELAEWDDAQLAALLHEIETGDPELQQMMADLASGRDLFAEPEGEMDAPEAEIDRAEELRQKWGTATGQLWLIHGKTGTHRLLCGDSTKGEDVARLMDGQRARLICTDPPYGVDFSGARYCPTAKKWDGIANDKRQGSDLRSWLAGMWEIWLGYTEADSSFYSWCAAMEEGSAAAMRDAGIHIQSQIIWNKNSLILGQADYQWKHENCWYGFLKGKKHRWFGGRAQTTVWEVKKVANSQYMHPMQKPTDLYAIPIENHTERGDIVGEPFCGSGSQLLAAEQLGRTCHAMELSPAYVGVILERCEQAGMRPELEGA